MARSAHRKLIAWPIASFVEFVRSTPLLVQLYFLYFVLPDYGIALPAFTTGVIALGVHYACYTSEVFRAGLERVPKGQWNAAVALNLTRFQTYRHVILPQMLPPIIAPLGNYLIAMFKETPLLSAITVMELLMTAKIIGSNSFRYMEPITIVGALFLIMSLCSSVLIARSRQEWDRGSFTAMSLLVRCKGVVKRFGSLVVLNELDFSCGRPRSSQ